MGQTSSSEIKGGEEEVGTAAVVEKSWRVEGRCRVATWELECPDREGLSDQEVLAFNVCQVASICCITSRGAMIVYHHKFHDPLRWNETGIGWEPELDNTPPSEVCSEIHFSIVWADE